MKVNPLLVGEQDYRLYIMSYGILFALYNRTKIFDTRRVLDSSVKPGKPNIWFKSKKWVLLVLNISKISLLFSYFMFPPGLSKLSLNFRKPQQCSVWRGETDERSK